jgi:hypothetical protein
MTRSYLTPDTKPATIEGATMKAKHVKISIAQLGHFHAGELVMRKRLKNQSGMPKSGLAVTFQGVPLRLNERSDRRFFLGFKDVNPFPGREDDGVELRCDGQTFQGTFKAMRIEPDEKSVWWAVADIVPRAEAPNE